MKTPRRTTHTTPGRPRGPLTVACPQCGAAPGWPCQAKASRDEAGNPYHRGPLKTPHRARKANPGR